MVLKYIHFPSQCLFFERAVVIKIRMSVLHFHEVFISKPVRRRLSIIKVFLNNFARLTEGYICRRIFPRKLKVAGWKETPVQAHSCEFCKNFSERLCSSTCANCCFSYLGISLRIDIFCKVRIEEMHSFLQHFDINSF